jgi:hypothetical protein
MQDIIFIEFSTSTFDHRTLRTRLPVRSALFKQRTGGLVVRWVTTSEYPLLNVFDLLFANGNENTSLRYPLALTGIPDVYFADSCILVSLKLIQSLTFCIIVVRVCSRLRTLLQKDDREAGNSVR